MGQQQSQGDDAAIHEQLHVLVLGEHVHVRELSSISNSRNQKSMTTQPAAHWPGLGTNFSQFLPIEESARREGSSSPPPTRAEPMLFQFGRRWNSGNTHQHRPKYDEAQQHLLPRRDEQTFQPVTGKYRADARATMAAGVVPMQTATNIVGHAVPRVALSPLSVWFKPAALNLPGSPFPVGQPFIAHEPVHERPRRRRQPTAHQAVFSGPAALFN